MTNPTCPGRGQPMFRDVRPMTITYKGHESTFDMPGWYCDASDESIHTGDDMKVSDRALCSEAAGPPEGSGISSCCDCLSAIADRNFSQAHCQLRCPSMREFVRKLSSTTPGACAGLGPCLQRQADRRSTGQ